MTGPVPGRTRAPAPPGSCPLLPAGASVARGCPGVRHVPDASSGRRMGPRGRDVVPHRLGRLVGVPGEQRRRDPRVRLVRELDVLARRVAAVLGRAHGFSLDARHYGAPERVLRRAVNDLVELDVGTRVRHRIVPEGRELVELGRERGHLRVVDEPGGAGGHGAFQSRPDLDQVVEEDQAVLPLEERVEDQGVEQTPLLLIEHNRPPPLASRDEALLGEGRGRLTDDGAAHLVLVAQDARRMEAPFRAGTRRARWPSPGSARRRRRGAAGCR